MLGVTAIVSVLANQLSAVTSISRITSSLADQGLLPRWFGRISPRFATPANSILTVGCVGLALALSGTFVTLAVISTVSRLFAYLACIAAIPRLDAKAGNFGWGGASCSRWWRQRCAYGPPRNRGSTNGRHSWPSCLPEACST